jgi:hypothetical protein
LPAKFAWQTGYGAFSVSESMINEVRAYIANQKEHHRKMSFADEYKRFAEKYGLNVENRCPKDSYGESVYAGIRSAFVSHD